MPWDFFEAVRAHDNAHAEQVRIADEVKDAYKTAAKKERLYRVALARKVWEFKRDGIAVTACETLAKGDEAVAALKEEWDNAEGLKKTAEHAAWCANADRRDIEGLIDWSKRRELAEGFAQPSWSSAK